MRVLAHRCYRNGPEPSLENDLAAFQRCLDDGLSAEIDIRRWEDGSFYISHDPRPFSEHLRAEPFFQALSRSEIAPIALNIKELGQERDTLNFLKRFEVINHMFLFDMELLEETPGNTARLFRSHDPDVPLAARVSDRNEPIEQALGIKEAEYIWLDEMDSLWATEDTITTLRSAGKKIYAISPEIHGFGEEAMIGRWRQFADWNIEGICTDYPDRLTEFLDQAEVNWRP
ncbi:MAG: hypothetical protein HOM58_14255 [Rhodospirillaceae bacterium]|jgi:glycerophosphoryl diester phosphodiesterase|nr:hypothetical protein [Rhodospirillaceae bacterium]